MPDLPEHVKAEADKVTSDIVAKKTSVEHVNMAQAVDTYEDGGKALDAMRQQKREDAKQEKNEPNKE